jgi:hypothetical protein
MHRMNSPEPSSELRLGAGDTGGLVRRMDLRMSIASRIVSEIIERKQTALVRSVRRIDVEVARRFIADPYSVKLDEYEVLDADAAKILAGHEGWDLNLNGLTDISVEVAEALSEYEGHWCLLGRLFLNGLTELSVEAAEALARQIGALALNGLTELSAEAARALAGHQGSLSLDGLADLSAEVAEAIAGHRVGVLDLNGLTALSVEAAEILSRNSKISIPERFRR